ncbi:MAG: FAD binding domain-containing protein [Alphaproteobacteria bacterium]|nr:FAD binding domain-containing protein [Alphaproteobacteria bacterium]
MKSAPFDYAMMDSVDGVTDALAEAGDEAMIIAGGQTLVPMMALRLARPALLVDINGVAELKGIAEAPDRVSIKACTRQAEAMSSDVVRDRLPLLAKALPNIGHAQTRNRGTVGGSIALGDPAAEIPLVATALDARLTLRNREGARERAIAGFYEGPMMALRDADECLTEVHFPVWLGAGTIGTAFQEASQRHGDFAIVAAAAQLQLDAGGVCTRAALAVGGAAPYPVRIERAEEILTGSTLDDDAVAAAVDEVEAAIDPQTDPQASAVYRRRVAKVLSGRVIREAARDARGEAS